MTPAAAIRAALGDEVRTYFYGCWGGRPGHYLCRRDGRYLEPADHEVCFYGLCQHIDASLPPRKHRSGRLVWSGMRRGLERESEEVEQGRFFVHHLDSGFTAMAWWDRTQGDTRGGCNSVVLAEGVHQAETMLAVLEADFRQALDNLARAGVRLVDAGPPPPAGVDGSAEVRRG